jgi:hypothetical protein
LLNIYASDRVGIAPSPVVIAGLDPAIHSGAVAENESCAEWMPGSSPGMTTERADGLISCPHRILTR